MIYHEIKNIIFLYMESHIHGPSYEVHQKLENLSIKIIIGFIIKLEFQNFLL